MPIPANQQIHIEVGMFGEASSQGSTSKNILNVYHFQRVPTTSPVNKAHVESAFQSSIGVLVLALLNIRYNQTQNTVRIIDDAMDAPVAFPVTAAGAITGDSMPSYAAAFVLMKTSLRGRSYRGNKHFGPLSESDTTVGTADVLNAAAIARYATLITALGNGFTDSDGNLWQSCIVSRVPPAVYKTNPTNVIANQVTTIILNQRIGRMKRRQVSSVY